MEHPQIPTPKPDPTEKRTRNRRITNRLILDVKAAYDSEYTKNYNQGVVYRNCNIVYGERQAGNDHEAGHWRTVPTCLIDCAVC